MERIYFSAWGADLKKLNLPSYAIMTDNDFSRIEAVSRAIARKNNLHICAGPRSEGTALENGKAYENHFAFTLGQPVSSGGYTPVAEVWVSIPIKTATVS